MTKNHLKRNKAPKSWNIKRKENSFIMRPLPGQSSFQLGMPLSTVLKEYIKVANSQREVRYLLNNKQVMVDNKETTEPKTIVGFMDVVSIPKLNKSYRFMLNQKRKLLVVEIPQSESDKKICKVVGKTLFKGKIQLNLYDGRNILLDKDGYKVGDSVLISLPKVKIIEHFKLEKKAYIMLTSGSHIGQRGTIESIENRKITYKRKTGEVFETDAKHMFIIGKEKEALKTE